MSIAIDLPRKRIYIRGDIFSATRWIKRRFKEMDREMPFVLFGEYTAAVDGDWTLEYNPEPL